MKDRLEALGGTLTVGSTSGDGTQVMGTLRGESYVIDLTTPPTTDE